MGLVVAGLVVAGLVVAGLVGGGTSPASAADPTTRDGAPDARVPGAAARVAVPTVTGPVTGGSGQPALLSTTFDLARFGYVTEEYFLSGTATAYTSDRPLTTDGRWTVAPTATAPYTTRVVVYRPAEAADFDGTAIVEWLNVSAGFDTAPGWGLSHLEMLRAGMAWVGVSAQAVGVQGGVATVGGLAEGGLKASDPERYAALSHPGDSYSFDIFSQAARAVRGDATVKLLGPLRAKRVIATGESQSATRMVTYVNALQPVAEAFDGFLVHSRFGGGAALSQDPFPTVAVPDGTVIRRDLAVPVLVFLTETDVGPLGAAAARQPDTRRVRTWEVAGTAHADAYTGAIGFSDTGDGAAERALLDLARPSRGPLDCEAPVNAGPQYAVLMAAVEHLDRWVRTGKPAPKAPRLEVSTESSPGSDEPAYVIDRDASGNALGGIRTPFVDVPRAAITGELNAGGRFCALFGFTAPFGGATVSGRYASRDAFLEAFDTATERAVERGFLLEPEADRLRVAITTVPYPG